MHFNQSRELSVKVHNKNYFAKYNFPNIIECEETFHQNKEGVGVVTKTFPLKLGITVYYDIFFPTFYLQKTC